MIDSAATLDTPPSEAHETTADSIRSKDDNEVTEAELKEFFIEYMLNDKLGQIADTHVRGLVTPLFSQLEVANYWHFFLCRCIMPTNRLQAFLMKTAWSLQPTTTLPSTHPRLARRSLPSMTWYDFALTIISWETPELICVYNMIESTRVPWFYGYATRQSVSFQEGTVLLCFCYQSRCLLDNSQLEYRFWENFIEQPMNKWNWCGWWRRTQVPSSWQ